MPNPTWADIAGHYIVLKVYKTSPLSHFFQIYLTHTEHALQGPQVFWRKRWRDAPLLEDIQEACGNWDAEGEPTRLFKHANKCRPFNRFSISYIDSYISDMAMCY